MKLGFNFIEEEKEEDLLLGKHNETKINVQV